MNALSKRLLQLRNKAGFSVRDLAKEIDKTPGYISRIEGRGEIPSAELICELASIYKVAPEELLELAKASQLNRTQEDIEAKHQSVLALYRKGKK
jgi:transcriptional regulator with XRE-family HTH domain